MYFSVSSAVFSGLEVAGLTGVRNLTGCYPATGAGPGSCTAALHRRPGGTGAAAHPFYTCEPRAFFGNHAKSKKQRGRVWCSLRFARRAAAYTFLVFCDGLVSCLVHGRILPSQAVRRRRHIHFLRSNNLQVPHLNHHLSKIKMLCGQRFARCMRACGAYYYWGTPLPLMRRPLSPLPSKRLRLLLKGGHQKATLPLSIVSFPPPHIKKRMRRCRESNPNLLSGLPLGCLRLWCSPLSYSDI